MQREDKLNALVELQLRCHVMGGLAKLATSVPPSWNTNWATSSVTFTSPDRKRILKIDADLIYTLDMKKADGTYKSARFKCKSVDEAWGMANQAIKVHRSADAVH